MVNIKVFSAFLCKLWMCFSLVYKISGEFVPHRRKFHSMYHQHLVPSLDSQDQLTISRESRGNREVFNEAYLSDAKDSSSSISSSNSPSQSSMEHIRPFLSSSGALGTFAFNSRPVFDEGAPKNVSATTGNSAYLHCVVHNLANKSVSWIRQRDLHILTVGRYTYTSDDRYQVIHSRHSPDWMLKIKYAQERDSGNYECQVSTKPIMSYIVHLQVFKAPKASIIGSPDMYVDEGSTINLTCIITHTPQPPEYIIWKHNGVEVSYDSPRGGVTMVTERGNTTTGYLLMRGARQSDTGNYTCAPSNTLPSNLRLHVLDGELPAAMQTNLAARLSISSAITGISLMVWFLVSGIFMEEYLSFFGSWKGTRSDWEF